MMQRQDMLKLTLKLLNFLFVCLCIGVFVCFLLSDNKLFLVQKSHLSKSYGDDRFA